MNADHPEMVPTSSGSRADIELIEPVPIRPAPCSAQPLVTRLNNVKIPSDCVPIELPQVDAEIVGTTLRSITRRIREYRSKGNEDAAYQAKLQLPAVVFSGKFSYANDSSLELHSGLMVVDFDKLPEANVERFRQALAQDPHTARVFTSSSGSGLKWVVAVQAE